MGKARDLIGLTFGRLKVIERAGISPNGAYLWRCLCECGKEKIVTSSALNGGLPKAVGA